MSEIVMSDPAATGWRRILVALDAEQHNQEVLQLALRLAQAQQAELTALLVESEQLAQLAGLPFVHEVHRLFATAQRLDSAHLARLKRRQLQQIRQLLQQESLSKGMRASVQAITALRLNELLQATQETDLAFLATSQAAQFVLKHSASKTRPKQAWVLQDDTVSAQRALAIGVELCRLEPYQLVRVQCSLAAKIPSGQKAISTGLRVLPDLSWHSLRQAISEQKNLALLIVPQSMSLLKTEMNTIENIPCPVLLVH